MCQYSRCPHYCSLLALPGDRREHRVGDGPNRIHNLEFDKHLEWAGAKVFLDEIQLVDEFEGEIGRSFEVRRSTSMTVFKAGSSDSFSFVLGNCMACVEATRRLCVEDLYLSV